MDYHFKYLKYKKKYLKLKKGGGILQANSQNMDFFLYFNTHKELILNNYENFDNLRLMFPRMIKIGKNGNNGFIYRMRFDKDIDSFYTILKTSINKINDNNYYEFLVGNCINKFKEYFPNFAYTFKYLTLSPKLKADMLRADSFSSKTFFEESKMKKINLNELQNNSNIGDGCENNDRSSILIEHIPNSLSIGELITNLNFTSSLTNINTEIYNILFQIYATLYSLREIYTQYDIHTGNVMFVEIPDNKKIQIDYNINGEIVSIYTSFIPVIIDYGRSFIDCLNMDDVLYSKIFSEVVCNNPKCNSLKHPRCSAKEFGLIIDKNEYDNYSKQHDYHYINIRNKNESADLRYLHNFMLNFSDNHDITRKYKYYFNNEKKWITRDVYGTIDIKYGVKEDLSVINETDKISNVSDCFNWLLDLHSTIYNEPIHIDLYGLIKINHSEKIKWTFEKFNLP